MVINQKKALWKVELNLQRLTEKWQLKKYYYLDKNKSIKIGLLAKPWKKRAIAGPLPIKK